jgi:hypothetical protein
MRSTAGRPGDRGKSSPGSSSGVTLSIKGLIGKCRTVHGCVTYFGRASPPASVETRPSARPISCRDGESRPGGGRCHSSTLSAAPEVSSDLSSGDPWRSYYRALPPAACDQASVRSSLGLRLKEYFVALIARARTSVHAPLASIPETHWRDQIRSPILRAPRRNSGTVPQVTQLPRSPA